MTSFPIVLRPLIRQDLPALIAHSIRVTQESGKGGNPIFAPYHLDTPWNKSEAEKSIARSWVIPIDKPGWRRDWGLFLEEKMVGNVDLRGSSLLTGNHRAHLGIGIELEAQTQGFGKKLFQISLEWARMQPTLDWVDLFVFSNNVRALKMYEAFGFQRVGYVADKFRVNGLSIDDMTMTLKLRD